jgi:thiamine-monophosphate kinase
MSTLRDLGEFGLIARLTSGLPSHEDVVCGVGDDCAVIKAGDRVWLVTTDASIEQVHFTRESASPHDIGWKAAATAISDIAAMGGAARFLTVTLACPAATPLAWLDALYAGIAEAAAEAEAIIIGGDVTGSPAGVMIDVAVLGDAPAGGFRLRSGACTGDLLAVTGFPGCSAAGLAVLGLGIDAPELVRAHLHPVPRLAEGRWLAAQVGVHAMIDVSDGVVQDAGHLGEASGLAVDIEADAVPIAQELARRADTLRIHPVELALAGGEDYELAVALDPAAAAACCAAFTETFGLPLTVIGRFTQGQGVRIDGESPDALGFDHFRHG